MVVSMALRSVAIHQDKPTKIKMKEVKYSLEYMDTYNHAVISYFKYEMILNIHTDTSYLVKS